MSFCTATLSVCSVLHTTSCVPLQKTNKQTKKDHFKFYLKQQLFGMNIIHQAGIIFINHRQLVSGCAHVQTAHSRGLLQQHDGKGIVNKYLQNLGILETKTPFLFLKLETAQQVQTSVLFQASHLRYLEKNCFPNILQAATPTDKPQATRPRWFNALVVEQLH